MLPLIRLLRLLTFASVPPLVVALGLVLGSAALLQVPVSPVLVGAALAGTWLVYVGERLVAPPEDAANHPGRTRWVARHRRVLKGLVGGCGLAGMLAAPFLRPATVVGGSLVALTGAAYALPLARGRRLKAMPVVKPLLVGVAWAAATVVLPAIEARAAIGPAALLLAGVRALTVSANVLLHDWPDRRGDAASAAGTLPLSWSWPHLRAVTRVLLGLALAGEIALAGVVGPLAMLDAVGVVLLLACTRRAPRGGWRERVALDLLVAWPLVTWAAAWVAKG